MIKELTCIRCPMGCQITAEIENGNVISIKGNTCKRGEEYAKSECLHPERIVTSTVRTVTGDMISVKTDHPIPKENIFDCMQIINGASVAETTHTGDVIIPNVFGANIVATSEYEI